MSRGNWVLLVGSAMLAAAVAAMATHEGVRSPEEELHGVQERLQRGRIDREEALDDLDRLVGRTLESGDPTFVARLRLSRGRLLMDIAAWDRARDDLRVALGLGVLDEVDRHEAEDDLIGLHIRAADYDNALNLVKSILDRNPRDGSAWMRSGEIHRAKADIPLASARDLIGSRHVADEALRAEEELDRLAAMDPSDPRRPAAGHALAARFEMGDEDRSLRILRLADAAARENAQARTAFATSLAVKDPRANPSRALSNIIELLDRAGRSEDAAEVGACGTRMMQARGDAAALGMFVDVLEKLGRTGYACDVAKRLVRSRGTIPVDRLLKLTKLFYANERWADLAVATGLLMQEGGTPEAQQAGYYSAMAQVHQGQYSTGLYALQRFLASTTPEPFEGARADAWKMVARAARRLRLADLEREALDTAIRLDRAGSGEEMLRMAGILAVSAHGGYRRPETQLALAMNALPERTEELLPMWTRYGQKSLEEVGLSAADVLTNDNWNRVLSGGSDASVYELYTVGRVLVYLGQAARAEFFVKKIRILVPNFVPGLDLWIRTMQKLHRKADLADALLLRMDLAGTDAETRRVLATLSPRTLSAERRIEFMTADPEGFGRREVARGFLGRGRPDLVLDVLGGSEEPNDLPEAREILAAANLALGRPQEAYAALLTEGDDSGSRTPATATGTELFARAALLSGHRKALEIAVTRTARSLVPRRSAWLRLSDLMISHGAIEAARPLVRRLDTSPRTRGGDVLLRLGWIQLLSGDFTGLEQTLVRADAFDTQGEADLLALLACADATTWSRLPEAVARVKAGGWRPTRIQRTALQILDQQPQIARALIDEALAQRPDDPLWILADRLSRAEGATNPSLPSDFGPDAATEMARFFGGAGRIDPRTFACMLTVLDDPKASGWIEAKLRVRLWTADGGLWDLWLMTRLAHVRGDRPSERARLEHSAPCRRWAPYFVYGPPRKM
jgi:tetratricopeptide (TPR) repeat protein